jgi:hypothetical protein
MAAFADRLRGVNAGSPAPEAVPTPPPTPATQEPSFVTPAPAAITTANHDQQRKLGLGLLGVAAALLLVAIVVIATRGGDDPPEPREAVSLVDAPTQTPASQPTATPSPTSTPSPVPTATPFPTATPPPLPTVPLVSGLPVDDAVSAVTSAGFSPFFNNHCYQIVAGTNPAAGSPVATGTSVELLFDPCVVPDFTNLQLSEAIALIEEIEGMSIEWPNHCDTTIIGQSVAPGTVVPPFSTTVVLELPTIC